MAPPIGQTISRSKRTSKLGPQSSKRKMITAVYEKLQKSVQELDIKNAEFTTFSDLPLSEITAKGLDASHYKSLTDIQSKAIPLGLQGHDILGAAQTGSGKTLAFLVPILENLHRHGWTALDGLGALIISPTRELAIQNFEVLRKVGRYHTFSAGLVIGGKSLQEERERLGRMNILVCTPGRMLQHMDQAAALEVDNLQILVLDEADRIMDMGFQSSVDAIMKHLPRTRQTLLFSATQTKKVSDLARLSLKDAEYVSVHETSSNATPSSLKQHYIITRLPQKLNTLFGFIRANSKAKVLVFLSSGKQVRFVYESFRHLQPGIPLLHLHGRQKQTRRLDITTRFSASHNSCLLATDIVARGLDFPAVDWVIQLDCPEDADTYIHRVGRTARYERDGRAVLFLDPSEQEGMLKRLGHKKVPIEKINVRQKKLQNIQRQLQHLCFKDPELKYLGQKAFISYIRSIFVQKDKDIFDIAKIDLEGFATSLGLPGAPKIKFQKGNDAKKIKNASRATILSSDDSSDADDSGKRKASKNELRTKYDRMFERRNQGVLSGHYSRLIAEETPIVDGAAVIDEQDNEFLSVKRVLSPGEGKLENAEHGCIETPSVNVIFDAGRQSLTANSKRREKLLKSKKSLLKLKGKGKKLVFDDDGDVHEIYELKGEEDFHLRGTAEFQRAVFVEEEIRRVRGVDIDDKYLVKEKKREKKRRARDNADRGSSDVYGPSSFGDKDMDDPLALIASLPVQGHAAQGARKRSKKWFEDDSSEGRPNSIQKGDYAEAAENLEDLEAIAAGILG